MKICFVPLVCAALLACNNDNAPATREASAAAPLPVAIDTPARRNSTTIVGLEIGGALEIDQCAPSPHSTGYDLLVMRQPKTPCWQTIHGAYPKESSSTDRPRSDGPIKIMFGSGQLPFGIESIAEAQLQAGRLVSLDLRSSEGDRSALSHREMLASKFGEPTITTDNGIAVWQLPEIVVTHAPDYTHGRIEASTPAYYNEKMRRFQERNADSF